MWNVWLSFFKEIKFKSTHMETLVRNHNQWENCSSAFTANSLLKIICWYLLVRNHIHVKCVIQRFLRQDFQISPTNTHWWGTSKMWNLWFNTYRMFSFKMTWKHFFDEKLYSYEVYGSAFSQRSCLNCYMWHTEEKPYTCEFCDSTFSENTHVKSYLQMHSGQKLICV